MQFIPSFRTVVLSLVIVLISITSFGQIGVGIAVSFGPPAIPVYVQPLCPAEGYIWVPGYWAWDPDFGDYFWVPGTWVLAPMPGYLWTPGYWAWNGSGFYFLAGYWGPIVGFYGGINYGFGYFGRGYEGGRWEGNRFYYNTTVNNVNVTNIHNTYNTTVINNTTTVNRVSYNGGPGGISARPTPQEEQATSQRHLPPVAAQTQHIDTARANPQLRASANQGKPPIAATDKPNSFKGGGVVAAQQAGAPYHPPANRPAPQSAQQNKNQPARQNRNEPPQPNTNQPPAHPENATPEAPTHAKDLPPHPQPPPPNTGNSKLDQKYEQQQQKLNTQQDKEHQQLAQQQEQEHQKAQQQQANEAQMQQMEQRHQQQTQQMEQKHNQQQQQLQTRQAPPQPHGNQKPPK